MVPHENYTHSEPPSLNPPYQILKRNKLIFIHLAIFFYLEDSNLRLVKKKCNNTARIKEISIRRKWRLADGIVTNDSTRYRL